MRYTSRVSTLIRIFALALCLVAAGISHARSLNQIATEVLSSSESSATLRLMLPEWRPDESDQDSGAVLDWPSYSLLRALPLPATGYDVHVNNIAYRDPTFDELMLASSLEAPAQSITPLPLARMRGIPLATVRVNLLDRSDDNTLRAIQSCEITLNAQLGAPRNHARLLSSSFCNLLRPIVSNLDDVAPSPVDSPEPYLVITRPFYENPALDQFVAWKQRKGHTVTVASTDETGTTTTQIKNFIQNAYDTWDEPPVYVLLIGDVDGVNSMPGWILDGFYHPTIISDHPYATLDGEDYLPDVFVGRFSVDTATELATLVAKSVDYEHAPFEPTGEWRTRMLICGVRSSPQQFQTYNSAWPTLRWIAGEFLYRGYTEIDSVPYLGGNASQINQSINDGVSFVAYRGFGSPEDWAYPPYSIQNMQQVSNGRRLPVITSIVCGGGAFDAGTDPCFGEAWMRLGTGSNQKGAVGFIGPSELDTKTRMNNTIIASMYQGVLHEDVSTLGGLLVRGKLGLYANFPNNVDEFDADANLSVPFYFNCYNLLGDPGLCFNVGTVNALATTAEDTLRAGLPNMRFRVTSDGAAVPNAWATAIRNGQVLGRAVGDSDGWVILPLPQDTGRVELTVFRPRYAVWEDTLLLVPARLVASESRSIVDDGTFGTIGNGDGIASPGERVALTLVVKNYGDTTYAGGAVYMNTGDPALHLETEVRVVPELEPLESSPPLPFFIVPNEQSQDGYRATLTASLDDASWQEQFVIAAPVPQFMRIHNNGEDAYLLPGGSAQFGVELQNTGSLPLAASTLRLFSTDPRVHITDGDASLVEVAAGATAWSSDDFTVLLDDMYPGVPLAFQLEVGAWAGHGDTLQITLPSGEITDSDPTAPDAYGYRCFDDGDLGYSEAPSYSWVEIDPALGGPGTLLPLTDAGPGWDNTLSIALPFEFRFYGQYYDSISISSNGFAAFGRTAESYFRNYRIPAIASPAFLLAPFWDDLTTEDGGRVCTWHDPDGGRFVIEWNGMSNYYGAQPEETFQLLLHDPTCWPTRSGDGDIVFQYAAVNNADAYDNYATIGIQDRRQGFYHEISYANESVDGAGLLRDGRALKFTTGQPISGPYLRFAGLLIDDDAQGGSQGNGDGIIQNGETCQLQFLFVNIGTESVAPFTGAISDFSPHANVLDNSITFGAIAAGDTTASSVVRVQFLNTIVDGEYVNFLITLSEGALPCVLLPSVSASGPVLSPLPELVSDDNFGLSQGNGNGEANPGESLELFPRVLNSGSNVAVAVDAHILILSGPANAAPNTTNVGTVEPQDTLTAPGAVVVHVNGNAENNQLITYRLTFTDAYGTSWHADREMIVVESILSYDHLTFVDPLPGGDGDGVAEPGETVEVYPFIRNEGSGTASGVVLNFSTGDPFATLETNSVQMGTISGNSERAPASPLRVSVSEELVPLHQIRVAIDIASAESETVSDELALTVGEAQFYEDFNGANVDGWLTYGEPAGLWHRQTREFQSAPFAFYCGDEESGTYPPFADAYLRTPEFAFSGEGTLRISMRYETQMDPDQCRIDLQTGVSTYHRVATLQGNSNGWITQEYPLDEAPADANARLRFWFVSNATAVGDGWYIDDVTILEGPTAIDPGGSTAPSKFTFEQNFPNPFNGPTVFKFAMPRDGNVKLEIFSLDGRLVSTLMEKTLQAGEHSLTWTPLSLPSGMYLARLSTPGTSITRKTLYLK